MDNKKHSKKIIPVVIIGAILAVYYIIFAIALFVMGTEGIGILGGLLLGLVPAILGYLAIHSALERIDEINGGEEDDLSKY